MYRKHQFDLLLDTPDPDDATAPLTSPVTPAPLAVLSLLPTLAAARERIAAVRPGAYARTRNSLDGAVTGLSPYLTHGMVSLREVLAGVCSRHALEVQHKFVYELGWRAFYRYVWARRGARIFDSLHGGPLPDAAYARELPADIRAGATGLPVIDQAVRTLYQTGTLHNHARMWLASYVVHLRKVHWRAGADWLVGHLLDGDLASNHLSWQWVAGTGSHKPYLFNAENVARYAPVEWHSPGTVVDTSYEALGAIALHPDPVAAEPAQRARQRCQEPALLSAPPEHLCSVAPAAPAVAGRDVWLVHPWSLGELPADLPADTLVLGLYLSDFHLLWPWAPRRWAFVGARMKEMTALCWHGDAASVGRALKAARSVRCQVDPHLAPWLPLWAQCVNPPALFPPVDKPCDLFTQWWRRSTQGLQTAAQLLARQNGRERCDG
ncbi:FAD-binding domain-containing protein [Herbaspirillum rubrisubalbicans]|uniref:Deoxyribodipyrimidine photolyase n=1 Tax=Herbaspirillum rubrisubalbicans TaxID=80842 RepID=A0AAD0U472_9BURK|nr:FAD-binding domain-containing protein [Herbaspirillum rubrisubalbicans]AYR22665.1 deoxyribodipyrimidine photolyase [Herbaspirillum rubrisubalbicans]